MKPNKFKIFICGFILLSTLVGNIFLASSINSHIESQRDFIKELTDDRKGRYEIYKEITSIKSDYTAFTVFTFMSSLFVVVFLLSCDYRNRIRNVKP